MNLPSLLATVALSVCLSAAPSGAGISVVNGLTHERTAATGELYRGEVKLANNANRPAQVKVYQTDYRFDASGTSAYQEIGSVARSNGRWIALDSSAVVTLEPRAKATIPYTVAVPETSGLEGTYWSVLMVEEVPAIVLADDVVQERSSLGIRNVFRYAVQVVTHIGDTGEEDFRVATMRLEARDPQHLGHLQVDLENVGERLLRADLRFELFDRDGRTAGVFSSPMKRIYPTTSARFVADFTRVPQGSYKLLMMIRTDSGSVYASEYELEPST